VVVELEFVWVPPSESVRVSVSLPERISQVPRNARVHGAREARNEALACQRRIRRRERTANPSPEPLQTLMTGRVLRCRVAREKPSRIDRLRDFMIGGARIDVRRPWLCADP
jgi:primosomal protein N''